MPRHSRARPRTGACAAAPSRFRPRRPSPPPWPASCPAPAPERGRRAPPCPAPLQDVATVPCLASPCSPLSEGEGQRVASAPRPPPPAEGAPATPSRPSATVSAAVVELKDISHGGSMRVGEDRTWTSLRFLLGSFMQFCKTYAQTA